MNKIEAALFLGVSVRTVENYTAQGRIVPMFLASTKSRPTADFAETDLRKLQEELARTQPVSAKSVGVSAIPSIAETALATVEGVSAPPSVSMFVLTQEQFEALKPASGKGSIGDLSVMPLLKLSEAARLTSIPEKRLRDAVKAGELVAHRFGRASQIRRADLDTWINQQFEK